MELLCRCLEFKRFRAIPRIGGPYVIVEVLKNWSDLDSLQGQLSAGKSCDEVLFCQVIVLSVKISFPHPQPP